MASCSITPISAFQTTNLNNRINTFNRLADRVVRALGAPLIQVELHQDQVFENISIAIEMFTKFAGYTAEYLVFDSNLYEKNKGLRLDYLFTLSNPTLTLEQKVDNKIQSPEAAFYFAEPKTMYIATSAIASSNFNSLANLSSIFESGIFQNQILDQTTYTDVLTSFQNSNTLSAVSVSSLFLESFINEPTLRGETALRDDSYNINNMFDYDVLDYRKVMAVSDFEEGSSTGINTLFTIEQTLAQQTYFSYAMGNYGFDLVSWYTLKEWLEMREKLLATRRTYTFNDRTQVLQMYPEPKPNSRFYGVVSCYVESPIRDVIKEPWVYQYTLALCKITLAQVRGKYGSLTLFGGQTFNATDLMTQGTQEKEKLETMLYEKVSPGMGDADPAMFFVG
jgi:hypothetical protein